VTNVSGQNVCGVVGRCGARVRRQRGGTGMRRHVALMVAALRKRCRGSVVVVQAVRQAWAGSRQEQRCVCMFSVKGSVR